LIVTESPANEAGFDVIVEPVGIETKIVLLTAQYPSDVKASIL
jgi:hypothetical protein